MRDAKTLCQIPQSPVETDLSEESDGSFKNFPLSILWI